MNRKDYETEVLRTADVPSHVIDQKREPGQPPAPKLLLCLAAMGLSAEVGEVVDVLKKIVFHGTAYDREKLVKELGDAEWYSTYLRLITGISIEEVRDANVKKLRARYPEGFNFKAANDKARRSTSGSGEGLREGRGEGRSERTDEIEDDDKTDIVTDKARPDAPDQDTLIEPYKAPPKSFDRVALMRSVENKRVRKPNLRKGQAVWESAFDLWPNVVEQFRGSKHLDPFHNDALIEPFLAELAKKLP